MLCHFCGPATFFRSRRTGLATALHHRSPEPRRKLVREVVRLLMAIDRNGLLRGTDDNFTVMTGTEMLFDLEKEFGVDLTVEIISQLG